jgi:hypothetical protein
MKYTGTRAEAEMSTVTLPCAKTMVGSSSVTVEYQ